MSALAIAGLTKIEEVLLRSAGQGRGLLPLQSARFGEIDPKPIASALIFAGHLGRGVAELLLHIAFLDVG